ncbi:MAG: dipeptidase [Bacteroidetes bacterium]|nr:dipeptidase [Bacteroidota bacterium]
MKMVKKTFLVLLCSLIIFSSTAQNLEEKAAAIHKKVLTLDSHTDTPLMLYRPGFDINQKNDPRNRGGKIDFPRMEEGSLDAVFFAVFVGQGDRTAEGNQKAKERALDVFEKVHKTISMYSEKAEIALTSKDAMKLKKLGKRAIYLGLENGYPLGNDINMVEEYYRLGARYITLSHTKNNDICDSSNDKEEHGGLTDFGRKVINEMNRIGMMVDVSHLSDKAFYDVIKTSLTPVVASHSNARAICDNPRNLTDDMLLALKNNGGVVQVCILSAYVTKQEPNPEKEAAREALREKYNHFIGLSEEKSNIAREEWSAIERKYPTPLASVSELVDHIDHIVRIAGINHVGIGTDFDGGGGLSDCFDVSQIGNITLELVRRGYSEEEIQKIWSGNFLRVFEEVENFRM